jgi:hypothetical protein
MSGGTAFFTLAKDAKITEDAVRNALAKHKMKLERFAQEARQRPAAAYEIQAEGLG